MVTMALYDDERERRHHLHAVQIVARDTGRSVEEVIPVYETELQSLKPRARVKDYLSVLVSQRVKTLLRRASDWH